MIRGLHRCRNYVMFVCALLLLVSGASALEAKAGANQHVPSGTLVTLDGSNSTGALTYNWTESGKILSTESSFEMVFDIGTHEITLTVSDGNNTDTDDVTVRVNHPPIADAGDDRVVSPNTYIKLDASGSTDPDGDSLSYLWKEDGEELSTKRSFSKVFDIGKHEITLTVTDNFEDDDADTVEVVVNRAPHADAGPDQAVPEGTLIHFDASNSSDPDGDSLSYLWKEDGGSILNSAPSFDTSALPCGTHSILLEVTDAYGASATDRVAIDVLPVDQKPPIACAGPDQTVLVGTAVTLDASNSSDPDGTIVKYGWLEAHTVINESMIFEHLFSRGVHYITLMVTDDDGASATDDVTITVRSSMNLPRADAGTDRRALAGTEILLDASGSDGENLTYQWLENGTILSEKRMFSQTFAPGTHTITLIVADEYECADTDEINITVLALAASGSAERVDTPPETPKTRNMGFYYVVALALILVLGGIVFMRLRPSHTYNRRPHPKPEPARKILDDTPEAKPEIKTDVKVPEPEPVHLRVRVLDSASKTPIPGVTVHAGPKTHKTNDTGEAKFTLSRGEEHTINASGIPNLYDGATASVKGDVATILLPSIVRPDQEQDARLRSIRQAFENRYREVSGYDRCIPGFYRSAVQRLIDYVRGITAVHFLCGESRPKEVTDRLISVIEVVCIKLSEIMVSKRNIDLYAIGTTGVENASECTASPIDYDSLSELIADPSGFLSSAHQEVQRRTFEIDDEITSRTRDMSVLPITGIWSTARDLLSDQSGDEIDHAMRILIADILLTYAREMYENPEIVKRMKLGIL
ncbi:MAG: PKD domain-containing protein [Euryarchaeota archaeon]|nr:PKD domain-containing protein [Euryarchaeota archaeon]